VGRVRDIGIREEFAHLLDPGDDGRMMHPFDSLNRSKARAVDIQLEALASDRIGVTSVGLIIDDKLATARNTEVILLTLPFVILTDVSGFTLRTLHHRLP
jgi:hypothetical protein